MEPEQFLLDQTQKEEEQTVQPVFIERDSNSTSQTNSSTEEEEEDDLKPSSYESSYSTNSTESDPVKNHNKLKRQGSRSSVTHVNEDGMSKSLTTTAAAHQATQSNNKAGKEDEEREEASLLGMN